MPTVKYVAGLDGLRAVAVIAVLLFHAEFSFAPGGFLGVSLFFTLSGFLITSLLIEEHQATGELSFRRFYGRRVRRLLPAAYACLLLVAALSPLWAASQLRALPGDLLAAVANVANWRFAFSTTSYQDIFLGEPSPVAHFWSLAIEEQIYLVLPVVVVVALRRGRGTLAATTGALLVASIAATLLTSDRDLVYNGTHTRAAELLVGVALAQVLRGRMNNPAATTNRPIVPGLAALSIFAGLVVMASLEQSWVYDGGLVLVALVSAVLIAAVAGGRFPASLLAIAPLVAIGKVSYGIYLFHWPVFLLLDGQRTGLDQVPLFVLRCLVTAVLTVGSYRLIEQPVRRGSVIARDRAMVPAMVMAAAAVIVAAVAVVPTSSLSETERLLALGDEEVVDFSDALSADGPGAGRGAATPPATVSSPAGVATRGIETSATEAPARVAVLGSEPATAAALTAAGEFDVVEDVRVDCPMSSTDIPGCDRLVDRWAAIAAAGPVEVLVLVTNGAELHDALARKVASVNNDELIALGAADEAAIAEIEAAIDAATAAGVDVVWYTPVHPISPFFRHFSRVGLERPEARTVVGIAATMIDEVSELVSDRRLRERGSDTVDSALRLLVIGDSTSLNFARALHDSSDGQLEVLWAGANGCPFATVEAIRGGSDAGFGESGCTPWSEKVPPLLQSFDPDVLFVMTGPTELQEHRFVGDPTGRIATDPVFAAAREAQLDLLLAAVGPDLPVLVADLPAIGQGRFSGVEMTAPDRLDAVNAQIVDWDQRMAQVARFPYRETLEAAEATRAAGDSIRSDGTHPDVEPLAELAREVYIDELIALVARLRSDLAAGTVVDG